MAGLLVTSYHVNRYGALPAVQRGAVQTVCFRGVLAVYWVEFVEGMMCV
jgi:hypothetical protein